MDCDLRCLADSGHLAIQYAKAMGLLVCAIDIDDGKLAHAKRVGADLVFNAKTGDSGSQLEEGGPVAELMEFLITAPLAHRVQAGR